MDDGFQNDINKRVAAALQGVLETVRLTNQRFDELESFLKKFAGIEEPPPIDLDSLREQAAAAAADVDELTRMLGLPDAAAGPASSN